MARAINRPDFKELHKLLAGLRETDAAFMEIPADAARREEAVRQRCDGFILMQARRQLAEIPVEELRQSRAGIRTTALAEAGYLTLYDLYKAGDPELRGIDGIGEKQVASIRSIIDEFTRKLAQHKRIRISTDPDDEESRSLLLETARCRRVQQIARDAQPLLEETHLTIAGLTESITVRSGFRWFFAGRKTKEETAEAIGALLMYCKGAQFRRVRHLVGLHAEAVQMDEAAALEDFGRNGAAYYAYLEKLSGASMPQELIYSSIPVKLADEISGTEVDLSAFRGDLRAYQEFGVKYILHQKRVLLGDEMGLGKTIQAIAVMAHLHVQEPGSRCLIVCPASVMINWCREIRKFSTVKAQLLHGPSLEYSLAQWERSGGAAVTNYESMARIVDAVNDRLKIALMVIDEAHYIKNPEAKRTKLIHTLEDESERILMMTGTPLENRVIEMCELISFLRPDLESEMRLNIGLQRAPQFKEMLAPVYLRRQRSQVLQELPPLTEQQEWCAMTPEDSAAYAIPILDRNFTGMRRVSFLQEDPETSSKAMRLLELCGQALDEGCKVVIYSYFRETIRKVEALLQRKLPVEHLFLGTITGSTPVRDRQYIVDRFTQEPGGGILLCQVQAGGTGLNIQAANMVIFCEPQIKPSLTNQAISRVYRMGQVRNVLVCHLLCENTIDEAVTDLLETKQAEFDRFADESAIADAADTLADREWIHRTIEEERRKYLPAVIP